MKKIYNFFKKLFKKRELIEKDDYYLYVRVWFKHGRVADFIAYPVSVANSGLQVGQIKKIRPLNEKQKIAVIRKETELQK